MGYWACWQVDGEFVRLVPWMGIAQLQGGTHAISQGIQMGGALQHDHFLLDFAPRAQHFAIPSSHFAKCETGKTLVTQTQKLGEVGPHEFKPANIGRRGARVSGGIPQVEVMKNPWIE